MKKNVNRRIFLRGLGGACVAAPFLGSMVERSARAQVDPNSGDPRRLIAMFTHYGCITERWFPTKSHGELSASDYESTTLKHVKDFAPKLLMPRGIRGINEWSFGREFGQETDPHSQVMASFLTAAPVDRESTNAQGAFDFDKLNALAYGRSIDHYISDQVNPPGVGPLVAHLGGTRTDSVSNMSYTGPQEIYNGVGSAAAMYAGLTNLGSEPAGGVTADTYNVVARGKSAIDVVRTDLDQLLRQKMSLADQRKLEHWQELLHESTGAVRSSLCTDAVAAELGISSGGGGGALADNAPLMMDLAVMNAICDQNRVILLMFPGTSRMDFIDGVNSTVDSHGLSHRIGDANMGGKCLDGVLGWLEAIDNWYAQQYAYLLTKLDSFEESTGTVLDNSAAIWWMEQSDGQAHNNNNFPIIQAGSCGGYFKTGMAVNVEDGSADLMGGNSLAQCGAGDANIDSNEVQSTSTPNTMANAPFNKYLYTLANALGVRGNADGFPEVGGTEKVSKFGWSDDPAKFGGFNGKAAFDSQAGGFTNPGEFEELLA